MPHQMPSTRRWGQARRLAFIDFRLQYEGRVNRRDLIEFFGISVPQASTDLAEYMAAAPANMSYDASARSYLANPEFAPLFGRATAQDYLFELAGLARGVVAREETFIGYAPPTGVVSTPARSIQATEVALWICAIRDRMAVAGRYQSMDQGRPREAVISPHAMGFDGLRWHVRAYCHVRQMFRDFAIGRFAPERTLPPPSVIDPALDLGWNSEVGIVLVPHPGLSASQRDVVMRDYGMRNGQCVLQCRKAMVFYTLRHLNLQTLTISSHPAEQHVVVDNAAEVARWMEEDRAGANGDLVIINDGVAPA